MRQADVVFAGGKDLAERKAKSHPFVHFFGCGVGTGILRNRFGAAGSRRLGSDPEPVIGWFGVIDERMDYDLLFQDRGRPPDWSFVLIGPVVKVDPALLPRADNIHWLGGRDYAQLPDYCRGFDVCMMPFALNDATRYINPTKALEYLATGRPVMAPPVPDVVSQYQGCISTSSTTTKALSRRSTTPSTIHP